MGKLFRGVLKSRGERLQGLEHNRQIHQAVKAYVRRAAPVRQNSPAMLGYVIKLCDGQIDGQM